MLYKLEDLKVGGTVTIKGTITHIAPKGVYVGVDPHEPRVVVSPENILGYTPPPKKPWTIGQPLKALNGQAHDRLILLGVDEDRIWIKNVDKNDRFEAYARNWEHP